METAVPTVDLAAVDTDPSELRSVPARVAGGALMASAGLLFARLVWGVRVARAAIADHEAVHGPIPTTGVAAVDGDAALRALSTEVNDAAWFFFPFGPVLFVVPVLLFVAGALLFWRHIVPVRATIAVTLACAAAALWMAPSWVAINTLVD